MRAPPPPPLDVDTGVAWTRNYHPSPLKNQVRTSQLPLPETWQQQSQQQKQQKQQLARQDPLVRDPNFWKRFSRAVHLAEEGNYNYSDGLKTPASVSSIELKVYSNGDDWLLQQRKKDRRCRCMCFCIIIAILIFGGAAAFAIWYLVEIWHPWA